MKKLSKIISLLLALFIFVTALGVISFSAVENTAGSTVTVTFTFSDAYGANGNIVYSNAGIFSSIEVTSTGAGGQCTNNAFFLYGTVKTTINIIVTATISPNAAVGDSCTISLTNCEYAVDDLGNVVSVADKRETVNVISAQLPPDGDDGDDNTDGKDDTVITPVIPVSPVEQPEGSGGKVTSKVDYTELKRQISIAESLTKTGYTDESWNNMQNALTQAKKLLKSTNQKTVDAGAKTLSDAIAALVKVDYTKLMSAIETVNKYLESNELTVLIANLKAAIAAGEVALSSGVQADIDSAAANIDAAYKALKDKYDELTTPDSKEVKVEVEREVEPEGDYCNITRHKVYIILLIISAVINLAFIALTVLYFLRKKKNADDTIPLVDYQIGDDDTDTSGTDSK